MNRRDLELQMRTLLYTKELRYHFFGFLFGYPECCIDSFVNGRHAYISTRKFKLPFVPCAKCSSSIMLGDTSANQIIESVLIARKVKHGFDYVRYSRSRYERKAKRYIRTGKLPDSLKLKLAEALA